MLSYDYIGALETGGKGIVTPSLIYIVILLNS
jgi:hypothetical protein